MVNEYENLNPNRWADKFGDFMSENAPRTSRFNDNAYGPFLVVVVKTGDDGRGHKYTVEGYHDISKNNLGVRVGADILNTEDNTLALGDDSYLELTSHERAGPTSNKGLYIIDSGSKDVKIVNHRTLL